MSHTIELKKVSKYYAGEESISMGFARVDLELDMGEFVAITGESGSGKSTLLNVISGLDTYDEGEMLVCGEDTTAYTTEDYENYRKTYIGNIFQDFNLVNSYTVYQNVELVMLLCGKKKEECVERVNELIELVGLTEFAKTKTSKLSGGQKQRVAIARALAKDAPIIVADEPTGNLDSESAELVMETLAKVSADKLVVIVTHNYEQAEPYVTRKLTMHDGRIIENRVVKSEYRKDNKDLFGTAEKTDEKNTESEELIASDDSEYKTMGKGSEIRLGVRNTFNIPVKFILLLIVYLFVATAVLGQYSSTKNSLHEDDILGYNEFFTDTQPERIVLTKEDRSAFTEKDIKKVLKNDNIDRIVENDYNLDQGITLELNQNCFQTTILPNTQLKKKQLKYGRLPEKKYEIVLKADSNSDFYLDIKNMGESVVGKKVVVLNADGTKNNMIKQSLTITGVIIADDDDDSVDYTGYCTAYVTDELSHTLLVSQMAEVSNIIINYDGVDVDSGGSGILIPSDKVEKGKAFVPDELKYNFNNGVVKDKKIGIRVENIFFKTSAEVKADKIITSQNIQRELGYKRTEYEDFSNSIFISTEDFRELFDKGNFQISAFMKDETKSDETREALEKKGFTVLVVKDTLTDVTGGFNFVIELLSYAILIAEFIVLFFIAYSVIKLIMKSRNKYYSTLRILGATKGNTDAILRVELVLMMLVAFFIDAVAVALVKLKIINVKAVYKQLLFLSAPDYVILALILLVMSLLIAKRYSRKLFTNSAMSVFRGEAK